MITVYGLGLGLGLGIELGSVWVNTVTGQLADKPTRRQPTR